MIVRPSVFALLCALFLLLSLPIVVGTAAAQSFSDLSKNDAYYDAVEELKRRGIVSGFLDGTFRPGSKVTRAEALKMILSAKGVAQDDVSKFSTTQFTDVPRGAWFLPYAEWALKELALIDGPPKALELHPYRSVNKAEFLKILLLSQGLDASRNADVRLPLTVDVTETDAWYYPFVRNALFSATTAPGKNGYLSPSRELTRGDVALLIHRFLLYKEGRRTQDLLAQVEAEALSVVSALNGKNVRAAEFASARALLYARGAKNIVPDETIVQAALKVTEGYRALVRGYRAQTEKTYDNALKLYQDAWNIGKDAVAISPSVKTYATGIQKSAQQLAEETRALKRIP
ncbi:MAG: S-layer homology domain-containing protein [Patescibacteria group bacterium]